jgi:predicted nucleic acid-binding protein
VEDGRPTEVIAVDTNILCYYWLASPLFAQAEALERRDPEWIVPPLWRSEFRNILASSVRNKVLSLQGAIDLMERAEERMREREVAVSSRSVMELVAKSSCTAYDCEFVAVARQRGVQLVTADRQILREFPRVAVSLAEFLAN